MLILFRSKRAFVGHFFGKLRTCFQLALLRTPSLTILGTAGMRLVCVRQAHENVGNLKSAVQVLISRVKFLFYRSKDLLEILTFECNQSAEAIKERSRDHLSLAATLTIFSYSFFLNFSLILQRVKDLYLKLNFRIQYKHSAYQ